jgi:hypothetical protein
VDLSAKVLEEKSKSTFAAVFFVSCALLLSVSGCQNTHGDLLTTAESSSHVAANSTESAATTSPDSGTSKSASDAKPPYAVECGNTDEAGESFCYVDGDTYIGWRTFHGFCHVCHAQDAVGSSFAPNLLDRMHEMDFELFVDRTSNGYTGQVGVMPPWKDNPNVSKRYKELYAYLKARADGALPPGRPKKKP